MSQGEIAGYEFTEVDAQFYDKLLKLKLEDEQWEDLKSFCDYVKENNIKLINSPIIITKNISLFKLKVKVQRIIFYFKRCFAKRKYIRAYNYIKWSKR